jgi:hypothetical protein
MLGFDSQDMSAALLWMQVLLVWTAANYLPSNDPAGHQELELLREQRLLVPWKHQVWARAVTAGAVVALLPGSARAPLIPRGALAILVLTGSVLLPLIRVRLAEHRNRRNHHLYGIPALRVQRGTWLAEWELGVNTLVAGASWLLIAHGGISIRPWIQLPLGTGRLASVAGCAALALAVTRGGAFAVRGVLNKVGALPVPDRRQEDRIDLVEFNRGRIIGVLERLIVLVLMAVQAYQAIAFLMAAKGLIRSKDLESRDFAEYFLIGTLASMALALVGGVAAQLLLDGHS